MAAIKASYLKTRNASIVDIVISGKNKSTLVTDLAADIARVARGLTDSICAQPVQAADQRLSEAKAAWLRLIEAGK